MGARGKTFVLVLALDSTEVASREGFCLSRYRAEITCAPPAPTEDKGSALSSVQCVLSNAAK